MPTEWANSLIWVSLRSMVQAIESPTFDGPSAVDASQVLMAMSHRGGGVSRMPYTSLNLGSHVGDDGKDVEENRLRVAGALEMPPFVACRQMHSGDVLTLDEKALRLVRQGWQPAGDAIVTPLREIPIAVLVADCVPVLLVDLDAGVIGVAHAGWRGTVQRIAGATVRRMQTEFGCEPAGIKAWIGPCIGSSHYQVGSEVVEASKTAFSSEDFVVVDVSAPGRWLMDLKVANRFDLLSAGLGAEHIEVSDGDTYADSAKYFSARRDGITGRHAALAMLR